MVSGDREREVLARKWFEQRTDEGEGVRERNRERITPSVELGAVCYSDRRRQGPIRPLSSWHRDGGKYIRLRHSGSTQGFDTASRHLRRDLLACETQSDRRALRGMMPRTTRCNRTISREGMNRVRTRWWFERWGNSRLLAIGFGFRGRCRLCPGSINQRSTLPANVSTPSAASAASPPRILAGPTSRT
jgi:hypothetical protein